MHWIDLPNRTNMCHIEYAGPDASLVCMRPPPRLETLSEVLAFIGLGAGIALLVSATVGSTALAWFGVKSQTFTSVWPLFWIGDVTGVLLVGPLALVVIQQWHRRTTLPAQKWAEATLLALIFLGLAALSLSTNYLASAYVIMPPLLRAAVRFEFKGVAVALTLLALITAALTISGDSHFVGDAAALLATARHSFATGDAFAMKYIMKRADGSCRWGDGRGEPRRDQRGQIVQWYAISIDIDIDIDDEMRSQEALRRSERQFQQMIDAVSTLIWCMTPDGRDRTYDPELIIRIAI